MKEKGRLEAAREGERDLCMCHGPHRVLLCSALIEFVSWAVISSIYKPGPLGNQQRWHCLWRFL